MLAAPFANLNIFSNVMAQGYEDNMAIATANIQQTVRNMNVEQVHLKASL